MSNSAKTNEIFSTHSEVPEWAKVKGGSNSANQPDAKKILNDINNLLSEARRESNLPYVTNDVQTGGAKKKRKSSKKNVKSKKASSKKSKKMSGGVKKMKKSSKKESSKKRKGSRKMSREMPKAMQDILDLKKFIKGELSDLKDGPILTVTASNLIKKHGGVDNAKEEVTKNKSGVKDLYKKVEKEQAEKRALKKAEKEKAKASAGQESE